MRRQCLLSRVVEFAGNRLPTPPQKLTAGLAAAALATSGIGAYEASKDVEPADAAAKRFKPMKPKAIKALITQTGDYSRPTYIRPKTALMTPHVRNVIGTCNPKNKYNPNRKSTKTVFTPSVKKEYVVYCDGYKKTNDLSAGKDGLLAQPLNRLGNRVAVTAGVTEQMHGDTVKARANNRVAVLRFKRPEAGKSTVAKPVKAITFKKRGKPKIVRYPKVAEQ